MLELQQTTEMNATGFGDDNNDTFIGNRSLQQHYDYYYESGVIMRLSMALGIPGNILSAIVWIRHHVAISNSPSAIYPAALAINDLVFLGALATRYFITGHSSDLPSYLIWSTAVLEALLVLSFSVVGYVSSPFVDRYRYVGTCSSEITTAFTGCHSCDYPVCSSSRK